MCKLGGSLDALMSRALLLIVGRSIEPVQGSAANSQPRGAVGRQMAFRSSSANRTGLVDEQAMRTFRRGRRTLRRLAK